MAKGEGLGVEIAEGLGEATTESVVREIDGVEVGECEEGCEDGGKGFGNLRDQATGEDISCVEDLVRWFC